MRSFSPLLLCLLLAACAAKSGGPQAADLSPPKPSILGAAVETAPLGAPGGAILAPTAPLPAAAPPTSSAPPAPAPLASPPPASPALSPAQQRCEARGGIYAASPAGGAFTCLKRTRDGGKRCDQDRDCQGQCLARSRTCAPLDPLLGCNEVLQDDGYVVNLCLN